MNETSPIPSCSRCGAPLSSSALKGLCPRCLMALNLAAPTEIPGETGPHGTRIIKPPPAPDEIAKHFPQFEILECLGRGGMGVVYKARQPKLNRIVALKILAPEKVAEPRFAERFEREAQALARLNHPNIVTVYDFGEADGLYYLTMEFVDGVSLRQLLQTRRITPEEALAIVPKICEALQFAHEQGVVHRDIKPENVLLDKQGRVKIADFGIAKIVGGAGQPLSRPADTLAPSTGEAGAGLTQDQVLGTPHYMAPEQREHPETVDHRADIYSLGVVFYELLTGELPLGKFQPPSQRVHIDVRLDEVVLRALEKLPELRYQQAGEVKTQLETIAETPDPSRRRREESQTEPSPLPNPQPGIKPRCSRTAMVAVGWAGFAFVVLVFQFMGISVEAVLLIPDKLLVALSLTAPFGTTILGWMAVSQIRHSAGRLSGLGLAVFGGLLFPLLALNGLIFGLAFLFAETVEPWYFHQAGSLIHPGIFELPIFLLGLMFVTTITVIADLWIVRREWLAVNRAATAVGGLSAPTSSAEEMVFQTRCELKLAAKSLMWFGVLGLLLMPLFYPRGWSDNSLMFGSLFFPPFSWRVPMLPGLVSVIAFLFQLAPAFCAVICVGAYRMQRSQNYRLARSAAMLAIVAPPLFPVGWPLGCWALSLLARKEVRQEFAQTALIRKDSPPRLKPQLSRLAAVGAVVAVLPMLIFAASIIFTGGNFAGDHAAPNPLNSILMILVWLGPMLNPLVAVLLGWIAWEDIRRGKGQAGGVALAAFACLLPITLKALWWLQGDWANWADRSKMPALISAQMALNLVVLMICGSLALWIHVQEIERFRSGRATSSWWLHSIAVRWVILGIALFSSLPVRPQVARTVTLEHPLSSSNNANTAPKFSDRLHAVTQRGGAPATNTSPLAPQTLNFGPVIEQEFTNSTLLDLDSGRIATEWPESVTTNGIVKNVLTAFDWMDREGLDFAYLENDGTFGIGMKVKNLTPDDWGNMTSAQLVNALASFSGVESRTGLNSGSGRPFVYGFKTREGGMGLLQLTGITDNPRSIRVRYKLVQNEDQAVSATSEAGQNANKEIARLKLQRAEQDVKIATEKVSRGVLTEYELQKVKWSHDIAAAEVKSDNVEVARLKLAIAELDLDVAGKRLSVGKATTQEYEQAKFARDAEMIRYKLVQKPPQTQP